MLQLINIIHTAPAGANFAGKLSQWIVPGFFRSGFILSWRLIRQRAYGLLFHDLVAFVSDRFSKA